MCGQILNYKKQLTNHTNNHTQRGTLKLNSVNAVELKNGIKAQDLAQDSELKQCEGILSDLSTMTLKTGQTLILKSNQEICVPHFEIERILDTFPTTP